MHHMATYCHHERMLKCDGFGAYWAIIIDLHLNFSELSYSRRCHGSEYFWSRELVMVVILINQFGPFYRHNLSIIKDWADAGLFRLEFRIEGRYGSK